MYSQRFLLTTRGKAAHAGLAPEEGVSAILEMAHCLQAIVQLGRADCRVWVEGVQGGLRPNVIAPECRAWITLQAASDSAMASLQAALGALPSALAGASHQLEALTAAAQPLPEGWQADTSAVLAAGAAHPRGARRARLATASRPAARQAASMAPAVAGRLGAYLAGQQAAMVALLTELARLETPSSQPETQRAAFALLASALATAGYDSTWWPGSRAGGLLLSQPEPRERGAPVQLLLGHCDTVWPVGTLPTMPLAVEGGRLHGPGVFDMKAGLVQAVFALRALNALELRPPATPVLLVNSDEETGSTESTRTIERLARIACRAFVMEPALGPAGKLKTARKGVGQFRLRLSAEQLADNALAAELARLIQALFDLSDLARGTSVNVGLVTGGAAGSMQAGELVVDVRVPHAGAARDIEEAVHALSVGSPDLSLEVSGRVTRMPLERTARNQALWRDAQRLGADLGLVLEEGAAGGASDGNTTSQYTATLDGLGAVGDGAHALHEHVVLDELPRRAALLALLLLNPPGSLIDLPAG